METGTLMAFPIFFGEREDLMVFQRLSVKNPKISSCQFFYQSPAIQHRHCFYHLHPGLQSGLFHTYLQVLIKEIYKNPNNVILEINQKHYYILTCHQIVHVHIYLIAWMNGSRGNNNHSLAFLYVQRLDIVIINIWSRNDTYLFIS